MDNDEEKSKKLLAVKGLSTSNPEEAVLTGTAITTPITTGSILEATQPKNYLTAIDYLTAQSGKLNAVTNQINFLTSPIYQPSILSAVAGVQNHLSTFNAIQSYLRKVDHLAETSPMMDMSRQATLAISGLTKPSVISGLAATIATNYQPWYDTNIAKSSILSASAYSTLSL